MSRFLHVLKREADADNALAEDEAATPVPAEPRERKDEGRRTPLVSIAEASKPLSLPTHSKTNPCDQAEGEPTSDTPSCWHCICLSFEENR